MGQVILEANGKYDILDTWFLENRVKCVMLVCGKSIQRQTVNSYLEELPSHMGVKLVRFMDFQPNPRYESVVEGVRLFREEQCDGIIAVGGGSAMDVAKCIKLYASLPGNGENGAWLKETVTANDFPFLAMPTTSGTGSEATRYAVIYYDGAKQSITDQSCIPGTVLMDASVLKTVPDYQKKATMMDALCHAIESYWSVNSTEESKAYSKAAIRGVMEHMGGYLANTDEGNAGMLIAANTAGKAINITQTTAGHAMCYKITSLFGCAHGHAAALCDRILYPWMIENTDNCVDLRGVEYLKGILDEIGQAMGGEEAAEGAKRFAEIFARLGLEIPSANGSQLMELTKSVNPVRLKNHPICMNADVIEMLYRKILNGAKQ